jgi:hypothetical protein
MLAAFPEEKWALDCGSARRVRPAIEADGFVRDLNPSSQQQFGDVPQTHTEAIVEPHAPTDDLRREMKAFVKLWSG